MSAGPTTPSFPAVQDSRSRRPLRLGFVPVSDCAPLVMARELGLFADYGLSVELRREVGWSAVQGKVVDGVLDAAHAPAAMPFAVNLSFQTPRDICVTGLVLSLQGNAITVSRALWENAGCDPARLGAEIRKARGGRTYTLGIGFPCSSSHFLLRRWLQSIGVHPEFDVHLVMLPPDQMFPSLKLGYVDGYCVGEPWTALAVEAGLGVCAATSGMLAPMHPEKVLMVRRDFAEQRAEEHEALVAALLEACAFCDRRSNRARVSRTLAQQQYVNAPVSCLQSGLMGELEVGCVLARPPAGRMPRGERARARSQSACFAMGNANEPSPDKAGWVVTQLLEAGAIRTSSLLRRPAVARVFRRDLFHRARQCMMRRQASATAAAATEKPEHPSPAHS